jgi:hypothetical protein
MIDKNLIEEQPRTTELSPRMLIGIVVLGTVDHFFAINGMIMDFAAQFVEVSQQIPF